MSYSPNQAPRAKLATQRLQFSRQLRTHFQIKLSLFLVTVVLFVPTNLAIDGQFDWCYWLILLATFGISWEGCKAYQLNSERFERQFQQWQSRQQE
ncbi:hypothetical protein Pse7367_2422 [Thalassoporum mexicanum PCC 7367]|uniref:2TM domain-containing protein n=1 Tax=Thalassoporum mexicanum TaxID=3457544 RepID=UPI00029FA3C3|nr:2TM domain-containing protein [Pseudanabaena sp. PCC 7367]AFY70683.1 hypothetical protein Pse7367_2422 [Pseudanabaena sp. PCC 7367]